MLTKTLIAALILASASIAVTSKANAKPTAQPSQGEVSWMDHASRTIDGGGN